MIGTIIFLVIAALIIYAVIDDKKKQKEAAREKAQKEAQKKQEERNTEQQIQAATSRILSSPFYKEVRSCLQEQIQKDIKSYLAKNYNEYMKSPGAKSNCFNPFSNDENLFIALGDIEITPENIHYVHRTLSGPLLPGETSCVGLCEAQIDFARNGYSNIDAVQMWVLAQTLSKDLGYQLMIGDEDFKLCGGTLEEAVMYLELIKSKQSVYRRQVYTHLRPQRGTAYIGQVIDSELQLLLQNSNISYRSPF